MEDTIPGSRLEIDELPGSLFSVWIYQHGLLRPLGGAELSDGSLRYLMLMAALLTPRTLSLMMLYKPQTSPRSNLLLALVRLIIRASQRSQVWVVLHSMPLIEALTACKGCNVLELGKHPGTDAIVGAWVAG